MIQAIIHAGTAFVVTGFPLGGLRAVSRDVNNAVEGNISAIDVARIDFAPYGYDIYTWDGGVIPIFTEDVVETFLGEGECEFEKFLNLVSQNVVQQKILS